MNYEWIQSTIILSILISLMACDTNKPRIATQETKQEYAMVIHGGAGTILRENMKEEQELAFRDALNRALDIGELMLKGNSTSIDVVEAVIRSLEDNPLFNAGKGAVFTYNEQNELDASIMDGKSLNAGAVGGVKTIKNPISAARAVMEKSDHVMLVGIGAESFAEQAGIKSVGPSYFYTERRYQSLQKIKNKDQGSILQNENYKYGTVGCVVLDKNGNIAAGTSTGGMTNKKYNRIGDSPIIAAGTYAKNGVGGISSTGHGEYFIRYAVAYDICARAQYKNIPFNQAADELIHGELLEAGGSGGVVGLDANGNITMSFNTPGMYRGYIQPDKRYVGIYKDE